MSDRNTMHNHNNNGLSGGQIALIIIGCILVLGLIASLIAWLMTDKRKNKSKSKMNIVQIGGTTNNEQQLGQAINQAAAPIQTMSNDTTETNNQLSANNEVINQQDKEQLIADITSEVTPKVIAATKQLADQKAAEEQQSKIEKDEVTQEQQDEDDIIQQLSTKEETEPNIKDAIGNEDKQKTENFDEIPNYSNNKPFAGFPLGMMMGANKAENLQPNFENRQPNQPALPELLTMPPQQNQNMNKFAEGPNVMPAMTDMFQTPQGIQQQDNSAPNPQPLPMMNFGGQQPAITGVGTDTPSSAFGSGIFDEVNTKSANKPDTLMAAPSQAQLPILPVPNNQLNLGDMMPAPATNPSKNQGTYAIDNPFCATTVSPSANKVPEPASDGIIMPLDMLPTKSQNQEQNQTNNNLSSAPKCLLNAPKLDLKANGLENNKEPEPIAFNPMEMLKWTEQHNDQNMLPTITLGQPEKNNAIANNNFEHNIEDQKMDEKQPMMQSMNFPQMFAEPIKTNQEASLDKNNSNQNENKGVPMGNTMLDFLMPNKNNSKNEQMQTNNNQSQINLSTQNKCNCPFCTGQH